MGVVGDYLKIIATSILNFIRAELTADWRLLRVVWVCRVSAVSALGGGALLVNVEQARDLFADTGLRFENWSWFFALLFAWAWLIHAMARRALQFDEWIPAAHAAGGLSEAERKLQQERFMSAAIWVPRILGVSVFIFVAAALWITWSNLTSAERGLNQAAIAVSRMPYLLGTTVIEGVIFFVLAVRRQDIAKRVLKHAPVSPLLASAHSMLVLMFRPIKNWPILKQIFSVWYNFLLLIAAAFILVVFVTAIREPAWLSEMIPRVLFLPILLGGGLLLFGEIASLSHRWQTPLLLIFFAGGAVLNLALERYNDVRWITASGTQATAPHQTTIADAIAGWKANNCNDEPCEVRPIIIAGAGGASRAGFFTATVVGAAMDAAARTQSDGAGKFRNRIFALSTVSGSSVGAAMMRAAWMDATDKGSGETPPCVQKPNSAWFGGTPGTEVPKDVKSWRDCFQQMMAGDFLSSVFVGIAYRDLFPIGGLIDSKALDRSGLLQVAFERWYSETTNKEQGRICEKKDIAGLCRPIGHLPAQGTGSPAKFWMPLLFFNGTSVSTGRRIIVSDVRVDCIKPNGKPFLTMAYDYTELRDKSVRAKPDCVAAQHEGKDKDVDLSLSSASMMSARFPIISAHGSIRDISGGEIVDTIVDGGYFENDGIATAADIARELIDAGLRPVVIKITNDPASTSLPASGDTRPPLPASQDRALFDTYTSIGRAIYATRSGHEDGHLDYLRQVLGEKGALIEIGVGRIEPHKESNNPEGALCRLSVKDDTEMKTVSMSWWMSQPVQAYLDAQLCRAQGRRLACVLGLGPNADTSGSQCAAM